MKKVFFVCMSMMLAGSLSFNSFGVVNKATTYSVVQETANKEKITEDKLPQAVKDALAADEYKGWSTDAIYLIKGEKEYYQISLKKDTETKVVNLDKDGKKVALLVNDAQ